MATEKDTVHLKVTLTQEEYELLKELAELEGRPMASTLMQFVRDAKTFKVIAKVLKALRVVHKLKKSLGRSNDECDDLI